MQTMNIRGHAPEAYVAEVISSRRLGNVPRAFTTRHVALADARLLMGGALKPRSGDLVLAQVAELRHHCQLQLPDGRRRKLFPGDEILVSYGNRYAPSQFEAVVPEDLGPCHLVAAGGVAANALAWHSRIMRGPTRIAPLGLVADADGRVLNLERYGMPLQEVAVTSGVPVIAFIGTAMNSGKTTSAAHLIHGLSRTGCSVGYAKVTGTGACGDMYLVRDAGARTTVDFTDAGYASTYLLPARTIENITSTLVNHLKGQSLDAIVVEVADGLFQPETRALVASAGFRSLVAGTVFAAGDAMGAHAGSEWLANAHIPVLGLTGRLTSSPLAAREAADCGAPPVLGLQELSNPETALALLERAIGRAGGESPAGCSREQAARRY